VVELLCGGWAARRVSQEAACVVGDSTSESARGTVFMPRFEKWLTGVAVDAPVDRVADKALAMRLKAVGHFFEAAVHGSDEAEGIHQLRIWTRRTSAALRLFAVALPEEQRKWLKKKLRKIRRTAGVVRDCDVQLEYLEADSSQPPKAIVKQLKRQRRVARKDLKTLRKRLDRRLEKNSTDLVERVKWPKRHSSRAAPPFGRWYRQEIVPLGDELLKLSAEDLSDDRRLHAFRIAGKRLRYALELAGPALAPLQHRQLYEDLSALQDRLGEVCDHLAAVDRLREWLEQAKRPKQRVGLEELLEHEQRTLTTCHRRFLRWWSAARQQRLAMRWAAAFA
jgi:CHAD domain-containing protein